MPVGVVCQKLATKTTPTATASAIDASKTRKFILRGDACRASVGSMVERRARGSFGGCIRRSPFSRKAKRVPRTPVPEKLTLTAA